MMNTITELTDAERAVIALTSALSASFGALPSQHPQEWAEFVSAMHRIQDLVAARPVWRAINADSDPFGLTGCATVPCGPGQVNPPNAPTVPTSDHKPEPPPKD